MDTLKSKDDLAQRSYARMVIGEAITDAQAREFIREFKDCQLPALRLETGFLSCDVLHEEGGNMVVVVTTWTTRTDCFSHHSSRAYRQFVAKTQHLLVGDFVVKLFNVEATDSVEYPLTRLLQLVNAVESCRDHLSDALKPARHCVASGGKL